MVTRVCSPRCLGGHGGRIAWAQELEAAESYLTLYSSLGGRARPSLLKKQTQEAETGELLEPRRQRLQWAKIAPLHSSLGNRARLS